MDEAAVLSTLIVVGVAYHLALALWFVRRRNVFPLTGRAPSLVVVVAITLMLSQTTMVLRSHPRVTVTCELIQFDRFLGGVLINLYLVRLFRVWYKIFASRDWLEAYRLQSRTNSSADSDDHEAEEAPPLQQKDDADREEETEAEVPAGANVEQVEVPAAAVNVHAGGGVLDGVVGGGVVLDTGDLLADIEEEGESGIEDSISAMSELESISEMRELATGVEAIGGTGEGDDSVGGTPYTDAQGGDIHLHEVKLAVSSRSSVAVAGGEEQKVFGVELQSVKIDIDSNEQKLKPVKVAAEDAADEDSTQPSHAAPTPTEDEDGTQPSPAAPMIPTNDEAAAAVEQLENLDGRTLIVVRTLTWFTKRPYLGKTSFQWKVLGAMTVFNAALTVVLHALTPAEQLCDPLDYGGLYARVLQGLLYSLTLIFAWKVRNGKDGYFIRAEFVLIGIGMLYFIVVLVPREQDRTNLLLLGLMWMGFNNAVSFVCLYPVAKSYGFEWRSFRRCRCSCSYSLLSLYSRSERELQLTVVRSNSNPNLSASANASANANANANARTASTMVDPNNQRHVQLHALLTSRRYRKSRRSFENHLAQEFSIENLLFYDQAAKFFKKVPDLSDEEVAAYALDVYCQFIAYDSPLELNIRRDEREPIVAELRGNIRNLDSLVRRRRRLRQLNKAAAAARKDKGAGDPNKGAGDTDKGADDPDKEDGDLDSLWYQSAWTKKTEAEGGAPSDGSRSRSGRGIVVTGRVSRAIFERTKTQIFRLLAQDSFVRWRRTQRDTLRRTRSLRRDSFLAVLARRASATLSFAPADPP